MSGGAADRVRGSQSIWVDMWHERVRGKKELRLRDCSKYEIEAWALHKEVWRGFVFFLSDLLLLPHTLMRRRGIWCIYSICLEVVGVCVSVCLCVLRMDWIFLTAEWKIPYYLAEHMRLRSPLTPKPKLLAIDCGWYWDLLNLISQTYTLCCHTVRR